MTNLSFMENAKVMAKGQITIPKDIRSLLGVNTGDRVTFIVEGNQVRIVNSAVYAMQMLQAEMIAEKKEFYDISEDTIIDWVKELRAEEK